MLVTMGNPMSLPPNTQRVDNECNRCKHKWEDWPGQFADFYSGCPSCGSLYWTSMKKEPDAD